MLLTEQTCDQLFLVLVIGCLPELAFDARERTLPAHMSMPIGA
jgi:hypothetical protein